ncbi:MAG: hypothetical protein PWP31_949 [Clostridia bacterium]|nr:hypothetical protein [Clostridia bacterium]
MSEQDLRELRNDIKNILEQLTALRIDLAKNYVTKDEFKSYVKQENANKWKVAGFGVALGGFIFGIIQWAVRLAGGD